MNEQKPGDSYGGQFAANIPRYFIYAALYGFSFGPILAVWVIFLQQRRGFSLTLVTLTDVSFWMAMALCEVPTGVVADKFGRKTSLAIGAGLLGIGTLAWAAASTLPLIIATYMVMGVGITFLSGAQDALLYESLKLADRASEYPRIAGRVSATILAATAVGSISGGLLGSIDLALPIIVAGLGFLVMLVVVLTFKEPLAEKEDRKQARKSYREIVRNSVTLLRTRPALRYPIFYLTIVPLASFVLEVVFVQPQAVSLGVPIGAIGVVVMLVQVMNMAGSIWSHRISAYFGQRKILYVVPILSVTCLILLAVFQVLPALSFIIIAGFLTHTLHPIVMNLIQSEVADELRATILSMQSLMFTFLIAITEPALGFIADRSGFSAAYLALAGGISILIFYMFWKSRANFPQTVPAISTISSTEALR